NAERATAAARALLRALSELLPVEGQVLALEANVGVALYPEHGADADTLLRRAAIALGLGQRGVDDVALYAPERDEHTPQRLALPIAVNLSARNLHDPELPAAIAALLEEEGVGPELLELEITESAVMHEPARVGETLARLRAMGLGLAIDDFGTGYSSLAYLKRL